MKNFLLLFCLLTSTLAFSQSEKEVEAAVQKLTTAYLAEDVATLRTLSSENLTYGHSSGVIENQAQFLAVFESKKTDYQKWEVTDQTVTLHGKKLAMVRHNVVADFNSNGTVTTLKLGLLLVWVKEKGEWKLLARQGFRLPA